MSGLNTNDSIAELKRIGRIQFGVLSPQVIRDMSVCEITDSKLMDGLVPSKGGLLDPRMGVIDRDQKCETCNGRAQDCPGHFGRIELAKPMYHIGHINVVRKLLDCVCLKCSSPLFNPEDPEVAAILRRQAEKRLGELAKYCNAKVKRCGDRYAVPTNSANPNGPSNILEGTAESGCGHPKAKISRDKYYLMKEERGQGDQKQKSILTAEEAHQVLRALTNETCEMLGFNSNFARPDWLLTTVLPVPPPAIRPSIDMGGSGRRAEDDLTFKLSDIFLANQKLRHEEEQGVNPQSLLESEELLQYHLFTYVDNELAGDIPRAQHRKSKKVLKAIAQRLKGKSGRIRNNLMGKRVDFSARSVITADPILEIDQVGVPLDIAKVMTVPEVVTQHNIRRLQELVNRGPLEHPGARFIFMEDGTRQDLEFSPNFPLAYGYTVERHLADDDVVLFNRQPTLHRMGMMGHRVKTMKYKTFRLNLSVTSPYNADFDGDEMNLHAPQSLLTKAELLELMMIPKNMISPKSNCPVMGLVQDSLLACRRLTLRDVFLERDHFMNCLMWVDDFDGQLPQPAILKPRPLWTGKQLFSHILPKVNLRRFSNDHPDGEDTRVSPGDTQVIIEQGELLAGKCCKRTMGTSESSLVHVVYSEQGPDVCARMMGQVQRLVNYWLLTTGFTIGIGDCVPDKATSEKIQVAIDNAKEGVTGVIKSLHTGRLEKKPGLTLLESFEALVNEKLNSARDNAGQAALASLSERNNFKNMVTAGSKGNELNISQVIACVGQQNVEGKRIPFGFRNRSLPHFKQENFGPESRGFVSNSYLRGLTPQEFFFHSMAGREGIIDTAVKTAETGYIQRRLIKAMEDIMVRYDGTVRDSRGKVLQFVYGEDGLDAIRVENQVFELVSMPDSKFRRVFEFELEQSGSLLPNFGQDYMLPEFIEEFRNDQTKVNILLEEAEQLREDRRVLSKIFPSGKGRSPMPVNIDRLIVNAQKTFTITVHSKSDLHPLEVIQEVRKLCNAVNVTNIPDSEASRNATLLFEMLLRTKLASKRVLREYTLDQQSFKWLLSEIRSRFQSALVTPGECVGIIAAQSLGEPATQMTLNTFHFAGVSAKNVTLGVPRLKEIINVSKSMKTSGLKVFLVEGVSRDEEKAKEMQANLEYCVLRNIVQYTQIIYDPDPKQTVVDEDADFVMDFVQMEEAAEDEMKDKELSPWVLRVVLNRDLMEFEHHLDIHKVQSKITEAYGEDCQIIGTPENADIQVIRLRKYMDKDEKPTPEEMERSRGDPAVTELKVLETQMLNTLYLKGVPGIRKVFLDKKKRAIPNKDGIFVEHEHWHLETEGVNLMQVLTHENVDHRRTVSNDIVEIFTVLGIEGVRQSIMNEIRNVLEAYGLSVNYRHLAVLCDLMTFQGNLMPITRHGINRRDSGPLMESSFEESVDILMRAAAFSEVDTVQGVSACVLLGQTAPIGTGCFDLTLDLEKMKNAVEMAVPSEQVALGFMGASEYDVDLGGMSPGHGFMSPGTPATPSHMYVASPDGIGTPFDTPGRDYMSPSPGVFSPTIGTPGIHSPAASPMYGIVSPGGSSPQYSPTSPQYSPQYSPSSPQYSPTSPQYSPTSPQHSPSSPQYSPSSPQYSPTSPRYSPSSPRYSPSSPRYSPSSPRYSPSSPRYSPSSPRYSPSSPRYSPSSPRYSPSSPRYSPSSPQYSPSSSRATPSSPQYTPSSPVYSPSSPKYSPTSPKYSPTSPKYSPSSPAYSPSSPVYNPSSAYSPAFRDHHPSDNNNNDQEEPSYSGGAESEKGEEKR